MLIIGKKFLTIMDKETLIRLATPASISLLAISIFSFPMISKANLSGNSIYNPLYIQCVTGVYSKSVGSCSE